MRAGWVALLLAAVLAPGCRDARFDAHVPPGAEFERLLQRDLGAYFAVRFRGPVHERHELLQAGPARVGAYPTYYAWVRVASAGAPPLEGVVVLRAVERTHFQVVDFASADELRRDLGLAERLFPRSVAEEVRGRLKRSTGADRR